jgi:hypothetical protein
MNRIHLRIQIYGDKFVESKSTYQVNESILKMFHYVMKRVIDSSTNMVDLVTENQYE